MMIAVPKIRDGDDDDVFCIPWFYSFDVGGRLHQTETESQVLRV